MSLQAAVVYESHRLLEQDCKKVTFVIDAEDVGEKAVRNTIADCIKTFPKDTFDSARSLLDPRGMTGPHTTAAEYAGRIKQSPAVRGFPVDVHVFAHLALGDGVRVFCLEPSQVTVVQGGWCLYEYVGKNPTVEECKVGLYITPLSRSFAPCSYRKRWMQLTHTQLKSTRGFIINHQNVPAICVKKLVSKFAFKCN
jgi:hypothetical protein